MNLNCSRQVATVGLCSIILVISSVRQKSDSCSDFLTPINFSIFSHEDVLEIDCDVFDTV